MTSSLRDLINKLKLPNGISFYEVDGQKLFPISVNAGYGGIATTDICYLIANLPRGYKNYPHGAREGEFIAVQPIEFSKLHASLWSVEAIELKLKAAVIQLLDDIDKSTARLVSMDGGELGRESDKPIRLKQAIIDSLKQ